MIALPAFFVPLASSCLRGSFLADGCEIDDETLMEHLTEIGLAVSTGAASLYAAVKGSTCLGIVEVRLADAPPLGRHYQIGRFYVREEERNRGIARRLLEYALLSLPAEDVPVIGMRRGELPRSFKRLGAEVLTTIGIGRLLTAQARLMRKWDGRAE